MALPFLVNHSIIRRRDSALRPFITLAEKQNRPFKYG